MLRRSLFTTSRRHRPFDGGRCSGDLAPASAQISINLGAPPAPQYEAVPAPRPGYAWAPGHWQLPRTISTSGHRATG